MVGTNDIKQSLNLYDKILPFAGMKKIESKSDYVGYASIFSDDEKITFYITKPYNNEIASFGNGTMLALRAKSNIIVDQCYAAAINKGAVNEGLPGLREGYGNTYYSYFRDLDNNKICIYSDN